MAANDYNVPTPGESQTLVCLYCGKSQAIGKRAMSITCKFCNKSLKLEDMAFKQYEARRAIETCGMVTIEKKGNVIADRILCGGLIVRGKVKGAVTSRGPVLVGPEAEIKGDVKAPALAVGAGAILDGNYQIGELNKPPEPPTAPPRRSVTASVAKKRSSPDFHLTKNPSRTALPLTPNAATEVANRTAESATSVVASTQTQNLWAKQPR